MVVHRRTYRKNLRLENMSYKKNPIKLGKDKILNSSLYMDLHD